MGYIFCGSLRGIASCQRVGRSSNACCLDKISPRKLAIFQCVVHVADFSRAASQVATETCLLETTVNKQVVCRLQPRTAYDVANKGRG